MPRSPDDERDVARAARSGASHTRVLVLVGGFALAVAATLAVFLTDNPRYLRIAVVAVAWAFVLAAFAAGRRTGDRADARMRESRLRHAYELELEREVAARREYELALENELRRETEDSMRGELDALRRDIAMLSGLRDEVARVSALGGDIRALTDLRDQIARVAALQDDVAALGALRHDVAALGALRHDVAALGALRDDVAGLASLREELGQLADLRADMGRLRAELTEQLSSEMLVERIVMRTQASRLPGEPGRVESGAGRALDSTPSWNDDAPPRELTGGWPAIRLDEPRETQQFEQVRRDRIPPRPPMPTPVHSPQPTPEPARQPSSWEPASWEKPSWEKPSWETPSWEQPAWQTPAPEPQPWEAPRTGWTSAPLPPLGTPSPATEAFPAAPLPPGAASPLPSAPSADRWSPSSEPDLSPRRSRHSVDEPAPSLPPATAAFPMAAPPVPSQPPPPPMDWPASRSSFPEPAPPSRPEPEPRRRRHDEPRAMPVPSEHAPTTQRPAVNGRPSPTPRATPQAPPPAGPSTAPATVARPQFDRSAFRFAAPETAALAAAGPPPNPDLARILAENDSGPATGSRRRRRYRDDDDSDDVLARVLRGE